MQYVMVPVPEQHVEEIMQRVLRLVQQESLQEWDEEAIQALFEATDEATRTLLVFVARAAMLGKPFSDTQAAEAIQLSARETATVMRDANDRARDMQRTPILVVRSTTEVLPNGRTVDLRLFTMPEATARMIRNAERAHLEQNPHPLLTTDQ